MAGFPYYVPFEEVQAYLNSQGYHLEPVYNSGVFQYYGVRNLNVGVSLDKTFVDPATGKQVIGSQRTIFITRWVVSDGEYTLREPDNESRRLYRKLYRRFRKPKQNDTQRGSN